MASSPSPPSLQLTSTSTNPTDDDEQPSTHDYSKGVKHLVDTASDLRSIPSNYVLPIIPSICRSTSLDPSIPIIDLDGLDEPSGERRISIIVNHGIKASLMEEMLRSVEGFFSLTWEEKMKYASDDVMHPVRYGTSLNTSKPHVLHWRDYLRHFGHPIGNSFHLWPDNPPNYREVAKEYLEEVWKLAMKIWGAISEGLGLDRDYIEKSLGEGCQIVASNYYPPCPEPHLTLGLSAHSDHGGLTILMQNEVDGLQVRHNDMWIQIQFMPGMLVVNIGDYLEILSNGRYKSVEHRAVVNEERTRISVAVGHGPELNAIIGPASPLVDEKNEPPRYRPIRYKDYMRNQQSSAVRGKEPLGTVKTVSSSTSSTIPSFSQSS
ncbi:Oxoglutarate/iron-dependent dioxygenase [Macleaya cordata]|uniref:Oxoglutarate/iron-dependent dioxygenase n=1 Tax=Macleaya cordata TaxID=56857 RepID=A0A200Q8R9_MACCD|nr:Oxoglutarate/iron-dependent dioxygenase [Macleaya cordata]